MSIEDKIYKQEKKLKEVKEKIDFAKKNSYCKFEIKNLKNEYAKYDIQLGKLYLQKNLKLGMEGDYLGYD